MDYSDLELVKTIKTGDRRALDILVRRWYPKIYGYVVKMIADEQDAYDITQDVFVAMMQNVQTFYPWKKFSSWLFTIAHNKCMDYFRLKRRVVLTDFADIEMSDPITLFDDIVIESIIVENALGRLSDVQREVILLFYFYQFTAREISRMTKTPLPTVKSRLLSAKHLLSKILQEGCL